MERIYKLEYWNEGIGTKLIEQEMPFKNFNEAFRYLYSKNYKVLNISFAGWKKWN